MYKGNKILIRAVVSSIVSFCDTFMKCSPESQISSQCDVTFWTAMNLCDPKLRTADFKVLIACKSDFIFEF